jgi:hypothetical protein
VPISIDVRSGSGRMSSAGHGLRASFWRTMTAVSHLQFLREGVRLRLRLQRGY